MLAMSAMGVARDFISKLFYRIFAWAVHRLWVTVRLEEKDAELVSAWLRERPEINDSGQLWLYSQRSEKGNARSYEYEPEIKVTTRLRARRKDGRSQWVWITRSDRDDGSGTRRLPGATVSFLGRDKALLESILEAGREIQRRKREKYLTVVQVYDYGKEHGLNWLHPQEKDRKQPGRSISSVVLPRCQYSGLDQAEALLEDAREFLASETWYVERGIPYRRGYLLHGIPGGGKSSLIMAVASELRLPIYMMQLSSELMSDDTLNSLLQYGMHDPPSILLLEDVDLLHGAVLNRRKSSGKSGGGADAAEETEQRVEDADLESGRRDQDASADKRRRGGRLTLSGLLNALDGPTATTGRLLFMTTNAKHRLDPALLRSGRIDYELEFTEAEPEQIQRLFTRFYSDFHTGDTVRAPAKLESVGAVASCGPGAIPTADSNVLSKSTSCFSSRDTKGLALAFAEQVSASGLKLSTADIQRHLMKRKTDPVRALEELPQLLSSFSGKGDATSMPGYNH
eukprot:TRINITY_DN75780_c0_g1_i1.p1 TRINITY_DN75780_c0_g1~~TRINITY_DN75780_c0_g1_i1.p1  ORF type:complete len:563 (+),score=94.14 TRINITY_DN75780_c0_g1_i1:153-1691(+)